METWRPSCLSITINLIYDHPNTRCFMTIVSCFREALRTKMFTGVGGGGVMTDSQYKYISIWYMLYICKTLSSH